MNEIKIFDNPEFGKVRVVYTLVDTKVGDPWFVGKDVADILGYSNSRKAIADHVDEEDKGVTKCDTLGGVQDLVVINESGLYSLILSSKLPAAKRFKRWVTSEVLPSIRKNSGYMAGQESMSDEDLMARAYVVAQRIIADRDRRLENANATIAVQNQQILEMQPKVSYYDIVLQCKNAIPITQIAKDYGWSANKMNTLLHDLGIQYHIRKTWVLYDKYAQQGYTVSKTHWFPDKYGRPHSNVVTQWTQKGRLFVYDLLKSNGYLPLCEMG